MVTPSTELIPVLHKVLEKLQQNPYAHVPNPPGCNRRASVALILRIRHFAATLIDGSKEIQTQGTQDGPLALDEFFKQPWVQQGDPEVLFIKRSARQGDRWSGHVALPGGRRDPTDKDDVAAAVRETREEVGLDLAAPECLRVGNLPERVVTTTWGKEPLMVVCPYIFIMTRKATPPLTLQSCEIAATHWVPLRALLAPSLRTTELVDVSSRLARQGGPIVRCILRITLGKMVFSAVRLTPSESLFASNDPGFIPEAGQLPLSVISEVTRRDFGMPSSASEGQCLHLWGLTLGVLADFLDMLPPYNAVQLWRYPTFTTVDLRAIVYLMTYDLRKKNAGDLGAGTWPSQTAADATTQAFAVSEGEPLKLAHNNVGIGGLGVRSHPSYAVGKMLSGYYERMNLAVGIFLGLRTLVGSAMIYWFIKVWRRRRR